MKVVLGAVSAGMVEKNVLNAASPPADAPMPTMGKRASGQAVPTAQNDRPVRRSGSPTKPVYLRGNNLLQTIKNPFLFYHFVPCDA